MERVNAAVLLRQLPPHLRRQIFIRPIHCPTARPIQGAAASVTASSSLGCSTSADSRRTSPAAWCGLVNSCRVWARTRCTIARGNSEWAAPWRARGRKSPSGRRKTDSRGARKLPAAKGLRATLGCKRYLHMPNGGWPSLVAQFNSSLSLSLVGYCCLTPNYSQYI